MEERQIYPTPNVAWLDVDLAALRSNALALRDQTGALLIPMVKANAYGVGLLPALTALEPLEPWAYGVATLTEGAQLRGHRIKRRVILFTPLLESEYAMAHAARLEPALGSAESIRAWNGPYHLAIDTGMNRSGVDWREVATLVDVVRELPPASVFTHFHSSELDDGSIAGQLARFDQAIGELGLENVFRHADNSGAAARESGRHWDAFRPGVFLYGVSSGAAEPEPVVALRARVVDLRWIEPGDTVSYDATYTAKTRERIATVAVGYADGYPRALSNKVKAGLAGRSISQRGLVTMDMTMFDVTDVECAIGDVVTLIGSAADAAPTLMEAASIADMSPYELLTGFGSRVERRWSAQG